VSDVITSYIRTAVPILVGWAIAAGLLPSTMTDQATAAATALIIGAYYALVRLLETKWPKLGWLLGKPSAPAYGA
jgi:hypothetical protein